LVGLPLQQILVIENADAGSSLQTSSHGTLVPREGNLTDTDVPAYISEIKDPL
jgi:hypothetical protein